MKNIRLIFALFLFAISIANGQITLQKIGSQRTKTIGLGSEITLKFPTKSFDEKCDCYHAYNGILKKIDSTRLTIVIDEDTHIFNNESGVSKYVRTEYRYSKEKIETSIMSNNLISLTKHYKSKDGLEPFGGTLMLLSVFHSLITAPLLNGKARNASDKITLGVFGTGLALVLIPNKRIYYFQQPKNKNKKALWLIKTQ